MRFLNLIFNRNVLLALSVILGLSFGAEKIAWIEHLTIPALAIVMTASIIQVKNDVFFPVKDIIAPTLFYLLFNFIILGAVNLIPAFFLLKDENLWTGFVIMAAAPPGVAIIPFTYILKGDMKFSLRGTMGLYILSIGLTPLVIYAFAKNAVLSPIKLLIILAELIVIPIIVSRVLIFFKISDKIARFKGRIVDFGLFITIFAIVALNRNYIFQNPKIILITSLIAFTSIFVLGFLVTVIMKKLIKQKGKRISIMLAATIKNSGFAAATALALFGKEAAIPGAVTSIVLVLFLLALSIFASKPQSRLNKFI